jgi:biopolymer transport protein ExbB
MYHRACMCLLIVALVLLWFTGVAIAQQAEAGKKKVPEETSYFDWFIIKGGPIGWLLIVIDVASWAIIIEHFISIRRFNMVPEPIRAQIGSFVEAKQYREMIEYTAGDPSFLSYVVHQAVTEAGHGYSAMERALEEATEERTTKLLRKIELLNIIGNVSPMMGLLGTVYGMIKVFSKIVEQKGMPNPAELAGGVGTALVTTFWGLIVAIPALAAYAVMRNRIDALASEATMIGQEIISTFRPGARKPAGGEPANSAGS